MSPLGCLEFGGLTGHACDLMALDSNVMCDRDGTPLPHFSPYPTPASCGVNLFAQDLSEESAFLARPYLFPPLPSVGSVLRFPLELQEKLHFGHFSYLPQEVLVAAGQQIFFQIYETG